MLGRLARASAAAVALLLADVSLGQARALHDAARAGNPEAIRAALAQGADINESDFITGAPLHIAVLEGQLEAVEILIDNGADLEAEDELSGGHPLHLAAALGRTEILTLLVARGADPEARDAKGRTPLILSTIAGHAGAVEALLDSSTDPDASEPYQGTTALHNAAFNGRLEVIELLLAHGAALDPLDSDGGTPLHWAVGNGQSEVIRLLVGRGADVNRKNNAGLAPIWIARYAADAEALVILLRELGARD